MSTIASRRKQQKKRAAVRGLADTLKMVIVMAVVAVIAVFVVRYVVNREPAADTYCEGVYVNGISLGGYTYEDGVSLVLTSIENRLNQTYTLRYGDQVWTFTPSQFNAKLDVTNQLALAWNFGHTGTPREMREQADYVRNNPVHYDSEIEFDTVLLDDFLVAIKETIDVEPIEATVIVEEGEILNVTQSVNGLNLSLGGLRDDIYYAIVEGSVTEFELKPSVREPNYTTEELIQNTQLIASYQTTTKASTSIRNKNIGRALRPFTGFVVNPGETISFNDVVGKRTLNNGFFESPEYDGTTVISGVGGGTCQASTTLYGALLKANLDVVVRSPHSMTVSYVKPSMDAAVSDRGKDLRFTNFLEYPVYIYSNVDSDRAQVNIYGPPCEYDIKLEYEVTDIIKPKNYKTRKDAQGKYAYYIDDPMVLESEGKDGLRSKGYRVYYDKVTGQEVERQLLSTDTYYASQPVYWVGVHEHEE